MCLSARVACMCLRSYRVAHTVSLSHTHALRKKNRTYIYLAAISISRLAFSCSGFVIISEFSLTGS